MAPRGNAPRSPPRAREGQSECLLAKAAKSPPCSISADSAAICDSASALDRVALERCEPEYINRMWDARICSDITCFLPSFERNVEPRPWHGVWLVATKSEWRAR